MADKNNLQKDDVENEAEKKEIKINPIKNGVVIDHISSGKALSVAKILNIEKYSNLVTIGLNLSSSKMGLKDCIKIEGRSLSNYELNKIAIIAPDATVSMIHEKKVEDKFKVKLPKEVKNAIKCNNPNCITKVQNVETRFNVEEDKSMCYFRCFYCERIYSVDEIELL